MNKMNCKPLARKINRFSVTLPNGRIAYRETDLNYRFAVGFQIENEWYACFCETATGVKNFLKKIVSEDYDAPIYEL